MAMILVVENDGSARQALCDLLRDYEHWPVGVTNGREALTALEKGLRPDVIVLNISTPVMDGPAFRAEQLKRPDIAKIPVVVISASEPSSPNYFVGGEDFELLTNPIPSAVLMSLIRQFGSRVSSAG